MLFGKGIRRDEERTGGSTRSGGATERLDYLRGMSSGAKRLVQSLRGRSTGGGRSGGGGRSDGDGSGGGGAGAASTSATRLFHYDSGHELDEISVVQGSSRGGGGSEGLPTPATPCNCSVVKYGSGQTLYSIAASVPPAPAAPIHRNAPGKLDSILSRSHDKDNTNKDSASRVKSSNNPVKFVRDTILFLEKRI